MRRFIYAFIAVMMLIKSAACVPALAESHEHGVCGETGCAGEGHNVCPDVAWTPWDGKTDLVLAEGENNYYLSADVEISKYINVARNQTLNLCLNGHTLTMTGTGCAVSTQWRFTLCDCSEGGSGAITHAAGVSGVGVETYGGGFYMYGGNITGNTAYRGAGVYVGAKSGVADNFYMYGGSISGNAAPKIINGVTMTTGGYGGGVYINVGSMYMYGGSIAGNTSDMYGGGISLSTNARLSVTGGSISGNSSGYGGGIDVGNKNVTISNAEITGNSAATDGGGVYSSTVASQPATVTLKNCVLTGNTAGKNGGAVTGCNLILEGCAIQDNTATTSGGGVYATKSLSIGGNMNVTGNELDSGAASNLYLYSGKIVCAGPLTGGAASVGIYSGIPNDGSPVAFMTGAAEEDLSALTCDRTTAYAGIYNGTVYFSASPVGSHIHEDGTAYKWWPTGALQLAEGDNYYFINQTTVLTQEVTISEGQTLHLCLNGKRLTDELYSDAALFNVESGSLVICSCAEGASAINDYGRNIIENGTKGTTTLRNVTLSTWNSSSYSLVNNKGMFRAENSVITSAAKARGAMFANEGTAVIDGGSIGAKYITSTSADYFTVDNSGAITFSGGADIYADANAAAIINREDASCVLEKGSVTGAKTGVVNYGNLEIRADASNSLTGNTVAIENSGAAVASGGSITGNVTGVRVTGGSFTITGSASVHGNTGEGASDIDVAGGSLILKDTSALIGVPAMKVGLEKDCIIEASGALRRSLQLTHALLAEDKPRANLLRRSDGVVTDADIAKLSLADPGDYVIRANPNDTSYAEAYVPARVYAISFDLAGGALPEGSVNPADYTSEDPTFAIVNPVKECHIFVGWTTADITDPMPEVVIYTGSEGAVALTANWEFAGHELGMDAGFVQTDIGGKIILRAQRSCGHADGVDIAWSVSDADILRPDGASPSGNDGSEAQFTALMPGCVSVTARTAEGSSVSCDVIVHSDARLVLPEDTVSVRDAAFEGVPAVEILLPEGIVSIGSRAFADCENLQLVNIPGSVTDIADDAFEGSSNLTIICDKGSAAEKFARDAGIACVCR